MPALRVQIPQVGLSPEGARPELLTALVVRDFFLVFRFELEEQQLYFSVCLQLLLSAVRAEKTAQERRRSSKDSLLSEGSGHSKLSRASGLSKRSERSWKTAGSSASQTRDLGRNWRRDLAP